MHKITIRICALLLVAVMLAGCAPATENPNPDSASSQDVYVSKVPLIPVQNGESEDLDAENADSQDTENTDSQDTEDQNDENKDQESDSDSQTEQTTENTSSEDNDTNTEQNTGSQTEQNTGSQKPDNSSSQAEQNTGSQKPDNSDSQKPDNSGSQTEQNTGSQQPDNSGSQAEQGTQSAPSTGEALGNEAVVLPTGSAAVPDISKPVASGTKTKSNSEAIIDYSNTKDGYVMVQYTSPCEQRLKVQVKGPSTTYTYNLTPQKWDAFPLSDDNGDYQVVVYKNVTGTKYAAVLSVSFTVSMEDEFAPYIRSNQYVNFAAAPATVATAASLAGGISDPLQKVAAIYNFVVYGMSYDTELAATVTSTYLPDLDTVLAKMSGICFDYAALMTGMLRSQGVPTKLIIGYAGDVYHAWINVWSASTGWVEGAVYFDGVNWQRMDPTFASAGGSGIMDYIGNGSNYSGKYFY